MQYVIDVPQGQDLQLLLALLERLQISYKPVVLPRNEVKNPEPSKSDEPSPAQTMSEKYAGKLSAETADALQQYIIESRNEWERSF